MTHTEYDGGILHRIRHSQTILRGGCHRLFAEDVKVLRHTFDNNLRVQLILNGNDNLQG